MDKFTVLIVDDEPANIDVLKDVLLPYYHVKAAPNGLVALSILQKIKPDIVLLDVMMPNMDGFEVCQKIKSIPEIAAIPVIFVTALNQTINEQHGFEVGAVDYITKPISPQITLSRVKTHLTLANQMRVTEQVVRDKTLELKKVQHSALLMLAQAGHYRDNDTGAHIWRMAEYCKIIALEMAWKVDDAEELALAAPMHDTGKIGIPDSILKAPRKLTDPEMTIMKTHSQIGRDILCQSATPLFQLATEIAYCHHEKWDGTGYPQGLAADAIPCSARIVAVADVYDALTTKRPYKTPWSSDDAYRHIVSNAGSHFDPTVVAAFTRAFAKILEAQAYWSEHDSLNQQFDFDQ